MEAHPIVREKKNVTLEYANFYFTFLWSIVIFSFGLKHGSTLEVIIVDYDWNDFSVLSS